MRNTLKLNSMLALGVAPLVLSQASYENTLTGLIGQLYAGLDVVSRELVGYIPSVTRNTDVERARVGQSVTYPIVPQQTSMDVVPAMVVPEPRDQDIGSGQITITKSKAVEFGFTGEEQLGLMNGVGNMTIQADMFAQGLRTLTNEIEQDLATEIMSKASRAYGTAGTTPYQTGVGDSANVAQILKDNGQYMSGSMCQVLNTTAGTAYQSNPNLVKVNEAGDSMTLRQGEFGNIHGFSVKESGAMTAHTSSGTPVNTDGSAYTKFDTEITMDAAGIIAGDVISIAGDANQYVVVDVAGPVVTIALPGLAQDIPAVATAVTPAADYYGSTAFVRSAAHLVMRAPALPMGGDAADDRVTLVDPRSGLVFEVSLYRGYRKIRAEVAAAWGVHASKSEGIALMLG